MVLFFFQVCSKPRQNGTPETPSTDACAANALRHDVDVRLIQSESGPTSGKTNTKPLFFDDCESVPTNIGETTFGAETPRPGLLSQGNRTYKPIGFAEDLSRRWAKAWRIFSSNCPSILMC